MEDNRMDKCSATTKGFLGPMPCLRKGTRLVDDKLYCWQHDPNLPENHCIRCEDGEPFYFKGKKSRICKACFVDAFEELLFGAEPDDLTDGAK